MTTDTSAEAVERLAAFYDDAAKAGRSAAFPGHAHTAATLRALLAERDAARAERDRYDVQIAVEQMRAMEARAEAARAWQELTQCRAALRMAEDALDRIGADPDTRSGRALDAARAALAQEAGR